MTRRESFIRMATRDPSDIVNVIEDLLGALQRIMEQDGCTAEDLRKIARIAVAVAEASIP